jgi:hypothetical protein
VESGNIKKTKYNNGGLRAYFKNRKKKTMED